MEKDKYIDVLDLYNTNIKESDIQQKVELILSKNLIKHNTPEIIKQIYSCIDVTSLHSTDNGDKIWNIAEEVNKLEGESDMPNVAAICVYPNLVKQLKEALTADVKIASVAGGFPSGQTFIEVKIAEAGLAIANGADEIDMVINLGLFFDNNYEEMCDEIEEIKSICRENKLKVIIETGALKTTKNIIQASILSLYAGADFIKTSTGKEGFCGATPEAAYAICFILKEYSKKTGRLAGLKVSGGISSVTDALKYYSIVKEVLGEDFIKQGYFRIGSSNLASILLKELD